MYWYYPFSALVNVLSGLLFGSIVLMRNNKKTEHYTFAFFAYSVAVWGWFYFLWQTSTSYNQALFWTRALMAAAIFIPAFYFHFTLSFLGENKQRRKIIWFSYFIFVSFFFINFTSLFVSHLESLLIFKYWPIAGPLYAPFLMFWIVFMIYSLVLFYKKYRNTKEDDVAKGQIKAIVIGVAISVIGGVTNYFLWFRIPILPVGNIFVSAYVAFTAYAIIKHQFLDIRLIIIRSVSYLGLLLILATTYIGGAVLISNFITGGEISYLQLIVQISLTLIVAFSFHPLRKKLEKMTNNLFFQSLPDEQEFLQSIGKLVSKTLDIKNLASSLVRKFIKDFQLEKAVFLLKKDKEIEIIYQKGTNHSLKHDRLEEFSSSFKNNLSLADELRDVNAKGYLRKHYYSIVLKLVNKDQVLGYILLGDKKSGTGFYGQELKLIELSAPSIGVALTNALQYAQIEDFSETLKSKVTEATRKLRDANKKLKNLDQRKDEFLSIAAHEMRAPLTAVKGYLSMVMDGDVGKLSKDIKKMLNGALVGADREIRLVNSMLNVSRIEENRMTYQMGETHLIEVVESTYMEFKLQAIEHNLQFTMDIADKIKDKIFVDQDRIHEVVANFVSNSIKYTDKGQVIIRLSNPKENLKMIRFAVSDTGYGMTVEEQAKLFQKFYRAESSAGKVLGTGLGLYTTKLLVEKFGGIIGVESKKGQGSTFWFELPLA